MKRLKLILLSLLMSIYAMASNICVDGIYYDFDSENKTAIVTYRGDNYESYSDEYTGEVVIPAKVTYEGVEYDVTAIGDDAFWGCSGLTSITIPEGVTAIGECAFGGCSGLTSITIPEGVTAIGDYAFSGCSGLTSITIPEGVTAIGDVTFWGCSGLTSITIPEGVTAIGDATFYDCSGLTSITIPEGVTAIGDYAFYGCSGLTSITIPEGVTAIGDDAFWGCSGLTSITIPEGVTTIGDCAFSDCDGLTSIIVDENNTTYDSRNNCNAIIETASNTLIVGCKLTVIPEGVTAIGESAFDGCDGLTSITIPESVTAIGYAAFYDCDGLTSITIPEGVTAIGDDAFNDCSSLTSITSMNVTPPSIGDSYTFYKVDKSIPVYVLKQSVEAYKSAKYWEDFTNIQGIDDVTPISDVVADSVSIRLIGNSLIVEGAESYAVYALSGQCLGKAESLERGLYIVVADGVSKKIVVK